jgi:hypothetical protein
VVALTQYDRGLPVWTWFSAMSSLAGMKMNVWLGLGCPRVQGLPDQLLGLPQTPLAEAPLAEAPLSGKQLSPLAQGLNLLGFNVIKKGININGRNGGQRWYHITPLGQRCFRAGTDNLGILGGWIRV